MRTEIIRRLNDLNREFYQSFARSFSRTRGRIQPGVRRIIKELPVEGNWLDLGCGNGNLAKALVKSSRKGSYLGVDGSRNLIQAAEDKNILGGKQELATRFLHADITNPGWLETLPDMNWNSVFLFATLHHIPGQIERQELCKQIHGLLPVDGRLHISVWQVYNSSRLSQRILPWETIGIPEDALEQGDVLMDWRGVEGNEPAAIGLRYVHVFSEGELTRLAVKSGFTVDKKFYSDGKEGSLGLYQIWKQK